jgi:adenylate cyclase
LPTFRRLRHDFVKLFLMKSNIFKLVFLLLLFQQAIAQTPEQRFAKATKQEQVQIATQIAQNAKTSDPNKAATWAQKAYDAAKELGNQSAMAQAAYLGAESFMNAKAVAKAKPKFERAAAHAETIGDFTMVSDCYTQLINFASRENNPKEVMRLGQIAANLLKKKGGGGTAAQSNVPDNRYQQLADENKALNREISNLRQQLAGNKLGEKAKIADAQRQLDKVRQEAEVQSKQLENQISSMSAEKAKAVLLAENAKRQQEKLAAEKKSIEAQQEKEIAEKEAELKTAELVAEQSKNLRNILLVGLVGLIGILILVYNRFKSNQRAKKVLEEKSRMIEKEQQRSEELLLNILPPTIAEELKREGRAKARSIPEASVLFTDFKNFTAIAEQLTPEQLVAELDYCFKGFDYIISQYNIEKIKTIGDAYMCASGLTPNSGTPIKLVQAAMEMQDFLRDYREEKIAQGLPYFEARIGIHTGPVVAGVVGNKKFAYDIWGDSVNLAARMEQNGEPNRVNISESTYWKVKYDFDCEYRGKLHVKNKGDVEMYFVKGKMQQ